MHLSRNRLFGVLVGALSLPVVGVLAAPAMAALPPGYQVQRIESPVPFTNGGFGNLTAPVGDISGDGKEDFAVIQYNGSLNNDGIIWTFNGVTGQVIRTVNAADGGGNGGRAGADGNIFRMTDIGSCTNAPVQAAGQPGPTCADALIGPPDGVNEILIGAGGVDVDPDGAGPAPAVTDAGRVYVLDGKTLVVLKRLDMPAADLAQITAVVNLPENAPIATGSEVPVPRGGFGRTATNPRGLPPCAGTAGIGTCATMPAGVRIGDVNGGGVPDVIVGANNFPETAATAHPQSDCAARAGTGIYPQTCRAAGRTYVFRGEDIAGSNPAVNLSAPLYAIKSISAQADDPFNPANRAENFGHSQMPVGDVGKCNAVGILPGQRCAAADSTIAPDGRPDFVVSAHRSDVPIANPDPQNFEVGVSYLFDGATGALLYIYYDPEPIANALFGFTTGQGFAVGNLGDTALPDVVLAGFQNAQNKSQAGRGYVFSGNFKANFINFATIDDPTPNTFGRFGNPTEGIGEVVGGSQVGNEVLVGQFSAVQTPLKDDVDFDVNFMNPANNQGLQTIKDPDAQRESGFGSRLMPLGDLNSDGFLDFAVSSVRWDSPATPGPAVVDQGRLYVFRSDPNAVVPPPPPPPGPGPAGPAGPAGASGASGAPGAAGAAGAGAGTAASVLAGRTVDLDASKTSVKRNAGITLRGVVEAFSNPAGCETGQSVLIQRRTASGARFTTFKTVKSSSKGSFSTKFKVTSTRLYRARVLQSSACEGAVSTREKVSVKKR